MYKNVFDQRLQLCQRMSKRIHNKPFSYYSEEDPRIHHEVYIQNSQKLNVRSGNWETR